MGYEMTDAETLRAAADLCRDAKKQPLTLTVRQALALADALDSAAQTAEEVGSDWRAVALAEHILHPVAWGDPTAKEPF